MDIRLPIGGLFTLYGLILVIYGMMTAGDPMYLKSLGININIGWGMLMLVFGVLMLAGGLRGKPKRSAQIAADKQADPAKVHLK